MERTVSSYHSIMESMKTGEGILYLSRSNKRIAELERTAGQKTIQVKKITPRRDGPHERKSEGT